MGTREGTPGTTRGTGVSHTRWGMRVLFGGNQLCFATSTRGTAHPTAPLFHSSGSRAARKAVSTVSFPHHPTTGHRRGHCVPDAALAPSHHPSSSSSITVGHPRHARCQAQHPSMLDVFGSPSKGGQTAGRSKAVAPLQPPHCTLEKEKLEWSPSQQEEGPRTVLLLPGATEALAVRLACPCSLGTQLTPAGQLMVSPMSQDEKTCVGNLSMLKMKA